MTSQNTLQLLRTGLFRALGSPWFFRAIIGLFVVQALYVSLTGRFSMAFDEYYHYGLIKIYSGVWLPWSVIQPAGPAYLGAVPTDTSYLYYYLMSFPYRVISAFIGSLQGQMIALRIIDVGIMTAGLFVYRALLRRLGVSVLVTHCILAVLVLVPVTSFLGGQLSYDTLFFTASGLAFYWLVRFVVEMRDGTPRLRTLVTVITTLALSSLVKYAFFITALVGASFMAWELFAAVKGRRFNFREVGKEWRHETHAWSVRLLLVLAAFSCLLFVQRYGLNLIRYESPVPDCGTVLGEDRCRAYDPYGRNISYREAGYQNYVKTADIAYYPVRWGAKMMRSLFFAVGPKEIGYKAGNPLPVAKTAGNIIAWLCIVLVVLRLRTLWRTPVLRLILLLVVSYIGLLFARNMSEFVSLGVPVAINGRYILHLLPLIAVLAAFAWKSLAADAAWFKPTVARGSKLLFVTLAVLLLNGGGFLPYVIRSGDDWMWPSAVQSTREVRSALWPYILKN